jgi:MraZ protein
VRPEWRSYVQRFRNLGRYNKEDLVLRRLLFSGANEIELDGQMRVLLPKPLMEMAGIGAEARFIGQGSFFEIWNPQRFDDFVAQNISLYDELMERLDGRQAVEEKAVERGGQDQRGVPPAGTES